MKKHLLFAVAALLVSCNKPATTPVNQIVEAEATTDYSTAKVEKQLKSSAVIICPPGPHSLTENIPIPPPPSSYKQTTTP